MMDFITDNYTWIFSGIGVFIIGLFVVKKMVSQKQNVKNNSKGIQVGRDINIKK